MGVFDVAQQVVGQASGVIGDTSIDLASVLKLDLSLAHGEIAISGRCSACGFREPVRK